MAANARQTTWDLDDDSGVVRVVAPNEFATVRIDERTMAECAWRQWLSAWQARYDALMAEWREMRVNLRLNSPR